MEAAAVEESLDKLLESVSNVDAALQPLLNEGGEFAIRDIRERHGAKAAAEVHMSLAFTVNALFYTYLKTQGVDPRDHPVRSELSRVQEYMKKVQGAIPAANSATDEQTSKLDLNAANRFIAAGLNNPAIAISGENKKEKLTKRAKKR